MEAAERENVDKDAAAIPAQAFLKPRTWFLTSTPSRRDGMRDIKEKSLMWEAAELMQLVFAHLKVPERRILSNAMVLYRRFFMARSLLRNDHVIMAGSALSVTLKLGNHYRKASDIAHFFVDEGIKRIKSPGFSSQLHSIFNVAHISSQVQGDHSHSRPSRYKEEFEKLKQLFTRRLLDAELLLTFSVGLQNLHDIGFHWTVLDRMELRYKLAGGAGKEGCKEWLNPKKVTVHPELGACFVTGRQLAVDFLNDATMKGSACCTYTPTTLTCAAFEHFQKVFGASWRVGPTKGASAETRLTFLEHYMNKSSLHANYEREDIKYETLQAVIDQVIADRLEMEETVAEMKGEKPRARAQRLQAPASTSEATAAHPPDFEAPQHSANAASAPPQPSPTRPPTPGMPPVPRFHGPEPGHRAGPASKDAPGGSAPAPTTRAPDADAPARLKPAAKLSPATAEDAEDGEITLSLSAERSASLLSTPLHPAEAPRLRPGSPARDSAPGPPRASAAVSDAPPPLEPVRADNTVGQKRAESETDKILPTEQKATLAGALGQSAVAPADAEQRFERSSKRARTDVDGAEARDEVRGVPETGADTQAAPKRVADGVELATAAPADGTASAPEPRTASPRSAADAGTDVTREQSGAAEARSDASDLEPGEVQ